MTPGQSSTPLRYEPIAVTGESTVVSEYRAEAHKRSHYQSEAELEAEFISILKGQAYEYLNINEVKAIVADTEVGK